MNIYLTLDTLQLTFVILVPIIFLIGLSFLIYKPIKKSITKKKYKEVYAKKIYKVALYEDFYLLNQFLFKYDDSHGTLIDHILFGDKFIYIINDKYFGGNLQGKPEDPSLILLPFKGKRGYIDNPLNETRKLVKRLSMVTGIEEDIFIGITLVNDDCMIDVDLTDNKKHYIIQDDKFYDLVKAIESRDVSKMKPEELENLVNDFARLNKKRKKALDAKRS